MKSIETGSTSARIPLVSPGPHADAALLGSARLKMHAPFWPRTLSSALRPDKKAYAYVAIIAFSMLLSLFLYVFYRTPEIFVNILLSHIISPEYFLPAITRIRSVLVLDGPWIYSLPGGLWVFYATLLSRNLSLCWKDTDLPLCCLPPLYAVTLEGLQYAGWTKGRGDLFDIVFALVFWLAALSIACPWPKKPLMQARRARQACFAGVYAMLVLSCVAH